MAEAGTPRSWAVPQVVDPAKINRRLLPRQASELISRKGATLDGDWDLELDATPLAETMPFVALAQRFAEGRAWEETSYPRFFSSRLERLMEAGTLERSSSDAELSARLQALDDLYQTIKLNGYYPQAALNPEQRRRAGDEIRVAINRDGQYLFVDGRHRLSIARILGLTAVPVVVVARHAKWARFRDSLVKTGDVGGGKIYHVIDHPDLVDLPAHHQGDRLSIVQDAVSSYVGTGAKLLDVGINYGYFSQAMSELGFEVTGIEGGSKEAAIARRIRTATESRFDIWEGDASDFPNVEDFEIVLLLNVFHHSLKSEQRYARMESFLDRLKANLVVFEPNKAPVKSGVSPMHSREFAEFVAERAGYTNLTLLAHSTDRRPVFKLER